MCGPCLPAPRVLTSRASGDAHTRLQAHAPAPVEKIPHSLRTSSTPGQKQEAEKLGVGSGGGRGVGVLAGGFAQAYWLHPAFSP